MNDKEALLLLIAAQDELLRRQPIWKPNKSIHPGRQSPQEMLFSTDARVVGLGGSGGGGKTFGIVGKCLMDHVESVVFRRNYSEFEEITKVFESLVGSENVTDAGTLVRFRGAKHHSIKAKSIRLRHLNNLKDWAKYAGIPHDGLFFDEVVNFPEYIVRGLMAWNRTTIKGQKCQTIMTFNPPLSAMGLWVISFFGPWVDDNFTDHNNRRFAAESGEILHVAYIEDVDYFFREPQTITHHPKTGKLLRDAVETVSRTFIRARLEDNPHLDGKEYRARLQGMSAEWQRAILYGEMSSQLVDLIGQIFKGEPYKERVAHWKHLNDNNLQPTGMPLCIGLDTAQGGGDDNCYFPIWEGGYVGQKGLINGKSANDAGKLCDWLENEFRERWNCDADEIPLCVDAIGGRDFIYEWLRRHPGSVLYKFKGSDAAGVQGIFRTHKDQSAQSAAQEKPQRNEVSNLPWYSSGVIFANKISAAWVRLGDATRHPSFEIALPPDNELQRQLTSRTAATDKNRMVISRKEDFIKDFGKSPNEADALVMAYWFIDVVLKLSNALLTNEQRIRFEEIQRIRCNR